AEPLDRGGGCVAGIDQKFRVLSGAHRPAAREAAASGFIDQLPGLMPRRVRESRTAGARADWLRGFARRADLAHALSDFGGIGGGGPGAGLCRDPVPIPPPLSVGEAPFRR